MTTFQLILIIYLLVASGYYFYILKVKDILDDLISIEDEEFQEAFNRFRFLLIIISCLLWPILLYKTLKNHKL